MQTIDITWVASLYPNRLSYKGIWERPWEWGWYKGRQSIWTCFMVFWSIITINNNLSWLFWCEIWLWPCIVNLSFAFVLDMFNLIAKMIFSKIACCAHVHVTLKTTICFYRTLPSGVTHFIPSRFINNSRMKTSLFIASGLVNNCSKSSLDVKRSSSLLKDFSLCVTRRSASAVSAMVWTETSCSENESSLILSKTKSSSTCCSLLALLLLLYDKRQRKYNI